jgi:capsular polysaccharide transport system permease protein
MSSAQTMNGQARLWRALDVQRRVIGALIMRELHTRFGRDNIGYAWIFGEPMLLAIAVTSMHVGSIGSSNIAMDPTPFWITGYTPFIMFRSIVSRAESVIEANGSLLYHRVVTLTDMLIARALLEAAGTSLAVFVLLSGNALLGLGTLPQRPLLMIGGLLLLAWFSFSISMLVCVGSEVSPLVGRLVHPAVYIALPLSGAFFLVEWIPEPYQTWLSWVPLTSIFELLREGQFASFDSSFINLPYVVAWCMVMTFLGLMAVRLVRSHLHIE